MYRFRLSLVVAALTVGVLQAHPGAHHEFDVKKTIVVTREVMLSAGRTVFAGSSAGDR